MSNLNPMVSKEQATEMYNGLLKLMQTGGKAEKDNWCVGMAASFKILQHPDVRLQLKPSEIAKLEYEQKKFEAKNGLVDILLSGLV